MRAADHETILSLLARIFGERRRRAATGPLYARIVAIARDPDWYQDGAVPDTLDGRFDMVAAVLALVLLRLEQAERQADAVSLTELFIADMDGSVRQIGIGDLLVGKHVGRMMGALGGRIGAFRDAAGGSLEAAVIRNVFHDAPPARQAVRSVTDRLEALRDRIGALPVEPLLAGEL